MRSTERDPPKSVLARGVSIMSCFQGGAAEFGIAELAALTGLPKPTVHRLVVELVSLGLLERRDTKILLGLRLFELGLSTRMQRELRDIALPYLTDLRTATEKTVHLAVLDGVEVVYIEKLTAPGVPDVASRVGGRLPAYCTGVGKALLAFADAALVEAVIEKGLIRQTPYTIAAPGLLRHQIMEIGEQGVAFDREESTTGAVCVACPVFDAATRVVAAISVTGRTSNLVPERVAPAVRTTALGISRELSRRALSVVIRS